MRFQKKFVHLNIWVLLHSEINLVRSRTAWSVPTSRPSLPSLLALLCLLRFLEIRLKEATSRGLGEEGTFGGGLN